MLLSICSMSSLVTASAAVVCMAEQHANSYDPHTVNSNLLRVLRLDVCYHTCMCVVVWVCLYVVSAMGPRHCEGERQKSWETMSRPSFRSLAPFLPSPFSLSLFILCLLQQNTHYSSRQPTAGIRVNNVSFFLQRPFLTPETSSVSLSFSEHRIPMFFTHHHG